MGVKVLDAAKKRVIRLQGDVVRRDAFYLAGGTGLGLRLQHRTSRDIDWFTARDFDAVDLARSLEALAEKPTSLEVQDGGTVRAYYGKLETSFIRYSQVVAQPEVMKFAGLEVPVADLETFACMKAAALHDRGRKRDFVDIHAISRLPDWSIERFVNVATSRLPFQPVQLRLALTYFADAEHDQMPSGYATPWRTVKADLQRAVREWEQQRRKGLER